MTEQQAQDPSKIVASRARDPVCGMNVNAAEAKHVHQHAGKMYYFCCGPCAEKFKSNPQAYVNKAMPSGLVTLEMPSVPTMEQTRPSAIDPVCGMTVNPATAKFAAEHEGNKFYFCGRSCAEKFQVDPAKYFNR